MYPAFDWSVLLRAIMDVSALAISLAGRPQTSKNAPGNARELVGESSVF
jgi:hypothetical protein